MADFQQEVDRVEEILGDAIDRPVEEHEGWHFGERVRVIEDDEVHGFYEGDEGVLVISRVGSAEYRNERVAVSILIDGTDSPMEIDTMAIEGI